MYTVAQSCTLRKFMVNLQCKVEGQSYKELMYSKFEYLKFSLAFYATIKNALPQLKYYPVPSTTNNVFTPLNVLT